MITHARAFVEIAITICRAGLDKVPPVGQSEYDPEKP